jgi:ketosteroid isomerase-like protein
VASPREVVRAFYEARARGDRGAVRRLLSDPVVWRLPGEVDTVEYRTADEVVASLGCFSTLGERGEIEIEPLDFVETTTNVAAVVQWRARGPGGNFEGRELAVYTVVGARIMEAIFLPDFSLVDLTSVLAQDES